jgi:TetR/AcrR family transcriptional regulator
LPTETPTAALLFLTTKRLFGNPDDVVRSGDAVYEEEGRSTRDLILDVGEQRFAERGFAAVSMREIAAEAGLKNQASLYHHFKNKRALYEAVLNRGVGLIVSRVAESGSPDASRDAVLDHVIDILVEHPHLPRLIQRAGMDDNRNLARGVGRLLAPLYELGLAVLAEACPGWPPADLPHLGAGLYQLIFGYFANAPLLDVVIGEDTRSPQALARQRRFIKSAVTALMASAPLPGKVRPLRRP